MVLKKNNIALTKPTIGYIKLLLTRHSKYFNLDLLRCDCCAFLEMLKR